MDSLFHLPSVGHLALLNARFILKSFKPGSEVTTLTCFPSCRLWHPQILKCCCSHCFVSSNYFSWVFLFVLIDSTLYMFADCAQVWVSGPDLSAKGQTLSLSYCEQVLPDVPLLAHIQCLPDWTCCVPIKTSHWSSSCRYSGVKAFRGKKGKGDNYMNGRQEFLWVLIN